VAGLEVTVFLAVTPYNLVDIPTFWRNHYGGVEREATDS
jgi:hypothetical protein